MVDYDWDHLARKFLDMERKKLETNNPHSTPLNVYWKGRVYVGSIQEIFPEYSKEIVLLSKGSYPADHNMINALNRVHKERLEVTADNELDLTGRQHVLRRLKTKLTRMTSEQTKYAEKNMPNIRES